MAEINIDAVIAEFGKKYVPGSQTEKDIKTQLFAQEETAKFFRKIPNPGSVYRSAYATIDEVLQAFQVDFTAKSTMTFKPVEYKLGGMKIDLNFIPDRFRQSWLGFLATIDEADRTKWPILRWFIEKMVIPRYHEDFEVKTSFYGWQATNFVASAPVVDGTTRTREFITGTITPANAAMDGLRLLLQKLAARMTVIATGALNADPEAFCTQIENFVGGIDRKLRDKCDFLFMSKDLADRYKAGRRAKYNLNYLQMDDLLKIENSEIRVQGLTSMQGSTKIWTTPAQNRVQPTNTDFTGRFDIQKSGRAIHLLSDHEKCLCFDVPELVVTNDLEATITLGEVTSMYS